MRRVRSRLTILLLILVIVTSLFSLTFGALVRNGIIFQQRDNIRYLVFGYAAKDILLLLIAVAAVAVLITVTSRSTTNPIRELSRAAREIAGGNYDVTVPERDRVEEFGELNDDLRDKQFKGGAPLQRISAQGLHFERIPPAQNAALHSQRLCPASRRRRSFRDRGARVQSVHCAGV